MKKTLAKTRIINAISTKQVGCTECIVLYPCRQICIYSFT